LKKLLFFALAAAAAFYFTKQPPDAPRPVDAQPASAAATAAGAVAAMDVLAEAYANRQSGVEVEGDGTVVKLLGDDSLGDRHQRFILRLASGQTVLVAHNIDVAAPVEPLAVGDVLSFRGEYEWNDKGGVIHWTHHDPQGQHAPGWLKHRSRTYQ
jgi:ABC-type glycerol-3-phosphate transport system substrate-binding protein